jgi:hypothetical protein
MIEAGERVREARRETEMRMVARMREGGCADNRGQKGERSGAGNAAHHVPHERTARPGKQV